VKDIVNKLGNNAKAIKKMSGSFETSARALEDFSKITGTIKKGFGWNEDVEDGWLEIEDKEEL